MKKKTLIIVLSMALVAVFAVTGAVAWLTATTDPVKNTFTVGNIAIELAETTTDYKMVPGNTIAKDPKVTVEAGSEACWLFVKIEKSANLDDFITYEVANGWTALDGVEGVYYRAVAATTEDADFAVLANDQVAVKDTVTKDMMDAITAGTAAAPTLTFTAYAIQQANGTETFTPAEAWAKVAS